MAIHGSSLRKLRGIPALLVWAVAPVAAAHSSRAPICEVTALPLMPMWNSVISPAPSGWILRSEATRWMPGRDLVLRIEHADPARQVRGVLLWAKSGPNAGAGSFLLSEDERFRIVLPDPPVATCGEWAISHVDGEPKSQELLRFTWTPPASGAGSVLFRAFLIEDCDLLPPMGCRAHQALTSFLNLRESLHFDGFEPMPPAP